MKRSEMTCASCDYSHPGSGFFNRCECRRHPPRHDGFVAVKTDCWCGDGVWREREETGGVRYYTRIESEEVGK